MESHASFQILPLYRIQHRTEDIGGAQQTFVFDWMYVSYSSLGDTKEISGTTVTFKANAKLLPDSRVEAYS